MSSEMIERVAKAIFAVQADGDCDMWAKAAKAAIEAMREPTEGMKATCASIYDYRIMIDAALKE